MTMSKAQRLYFQLASALIAVSAIMYCSWPLGLWLNPAASRAGLASELGAIGQPYNWLFIGGDIVSGILLVVGCMMLWWLLSPLHWARWVLVMLAIYGICGALDAALPLQCSPSLQVCKPVLQDPILILHGIFDLLGSVTLIGTLIAGWLHARQGDRTWLPWVYTIGIGGTLFAIASGVLYIVNGPGYWAQRYYITLSCIWVLSIPFVLRAKSLYAK